MRKLIGGLTELTGVMLVVLGLVVCMCDTADIDRQLITGLYGVGIMAVGVMIAFLGKGVEEECIR